MKNQAKNVNKNILNNRFIGAIDFLKKQSTNNGAKKLFDLPWHFILSTPNSGKSSLLEHVDLEFILKRKKLSPSTNYCEWWATKQAVFVDLNQEYCNANIKKEQQQKWNDFLTLTYQTKKQPIKALWLVLDLPTILTIHKENQKNFGLMLKNRIKELQKKLNKYFPVYIIINKMDALKGFVDFFDDLSNQERAQPWGMNFTPKHSANSQRLAEHFETEFNDILKTLNVRVINRLHQERNLNKRVNIKDFPLQMESIKKPLAMLLQVLSANITGNNESTLRGIFFTSAQPSAMAEDRLLAPLSNTFALQTYNANQYIEPQQDYFVKELFKDIILPDVQDYYAANNKPASTKKQWQLTTMSAAVLIIFASAGYFIHSYMRDNNNIRLTEDALAQYEVIKSSADAFDIKANLLALNKLNQAYQILANEQFSSVTRLTEKNLTELPDNAKIAYIEALQKVITNQLQLIIQQQLSSEQINPSELYGALKAYLMLSETQYYQPSYIKQWLRNYWQYHNQLSEDDLNLLDTHVDNFLRFSAVQLPVDQSLVISAREKLSQIPSAKLINVILENNNNQAPLDIVLADNKQAIFTANNKSITIPGIYTAHAFEHVYDAVLPETAQQLQQGDWVTGRQGFGINLDRDMLMQIRKQYISNYIQAWDNVINQIQLKPIQSYQNAIYVMQSLAHPNKEVKDMMATIYKNTNVSYHNSGTPISEHFAKLDKIIYLFRRSQNSNLNMSISYLQNIIANDNTPIAAFEFIKNQDMLGDKQNPFKNMAIIANNAPQPIKNWTNSLLKDTWQLLLNDAAITVNAAWKHDVYQYYQLNLAGEYPFDAHATKDASINSFNQFMSKNGVFNNFYNIYLADLINENFYGAKLPLSTDALQQVTMMQRVSELFYTDKNPNNFTFNFTFAPEKITGNAKAVDLNFDQQAATYSKTFMSPTHFSWPGQSDQLFAALIFVGNDGEQQSITKTGAWAVFKLLNPPDSKVTQVNNNTIETHINLPAYSLAYALTSNSDLNPFTPGLLIGMNVPADLINKQIED